MGGALVLAALSGLTSDEVLEAIESGYEVLLGS